MQSNQDSFERRLERAGRQRMQDGRTRSYTVWWIASALAGLAAAPFLVTWEPDPNLIANLRLAAEEWIARFSALAPPDYQAYVPWAMLAFGVLVLFAARRLLASLLRGSRFLIGAALGAALWLPFGEQIRALVPQIDQRLPGLQASIDQVADTNRIAGRLQTLGQQVWPTAAAVAENGEES